jgi:hypothetical protein
LTRHDKPLGILMCLPLAVVGAVLGAFLGFVVVIFVGAIHSGDGNGGLIATFAGAPVGAAVGGVLGFRTARRL